MFMLMVNMFIFAQEKTSKWKVVEIQTLVSCSDGCAEFKPIIEDALNYTKGVKFAEMDKSTRIVKIKYNAEKVSKEQLLKVMVDTGYEIEGFEINQEARKKLPSCCRPELEQNGHDH